MALGQRAERKALQLPGVLRRWAPRVQGTTAGAGNSPTSTVMCCVTSTVPSPPRVLHVETEAQNGGGPCLRLHTERGEVGFELSCRGQRP